MSKHSSIIGGSTADRVLNCPGSFRQLMLLPEQIEAPSEYANYGTAMHMVMDDLMQMYGDGFPPLADIYHTAGQMLGETFHDRVLEQHHLRDSIMPAISALYELMMDYDNGFRVLANELKVDFPGVPGAHGTSDLLIANSKHIVMVDWKFGQGVPVKAVYEEPDGESKVNPQLMFYFAAAMHTLPAKIFHGKRLAIAIIQPRTEEALTHTVITRTEVRMFVEDVERAITLAVGPNPPLVMGDHCRWCPARPHCPLHTGPLFHLVELDILPAELKASTADMEDPSYGIFLAKAKYLADLAAGYKKQVDEAMHAYLENGGTVPGWHLKQKTKLRQWIDTETVAIALTELGFRAEDIWQEKLQTFGHTDKVAKRLGVTIPDHLRVSPPTDETVLAPDGDGSPRVDRAAAALELQAALKGLQHGR